MTAVISKLKVHFPDRNDEVRMIGITGTWSVATQHFVAKVKWVNYFLTFTTFLTFSSSVFCFFYLA